MARDLALVGDWFTITKITVKMSPSLGGYETELDFEPLIILDNLDASGELGEIISISGVAHPPKRHATVAFRIDESGLRLAKNADDATAAEITPRLRGTIGT